MGRKWIAIIVIIALISGLCIWENLFIQDSFNYLIDRLDAVEIMLSKDTENIDTETNINEIEDLHKDWQQRSKTLKAIVWHTGIKDVEVNLSRILSYTEENDYKEAMVELHALQDFCKHYQNDFIITLENIL